MFSIDFIRLKTTISDLSNSFFTKSVMDPKSCLHYLLPEPRGDSVDKFRRPLSLVPPTAPRQAVAIIPFYTKLLIITNNHMFINCVFYHGFYVISLKFYFRVSTANFCVLYSSAIYNYFIVLFSM